MNYKFLLLIYILINLGCGNSGLRNSNSKEDVKFRVDELFNKWNNNYNKLCEEPRNDYLKLEISKDVK